jgi:Cys-tRNA(Pro)/Cys-tRNA(Cys) deacylase
MTATKAEKTLAMRVLESEGVTYRAVFYAVAEHLSAAEVATAVGLPVAQAFKTLVALPARPGARPVLALVPGDASLDLKKLAHVLGEKKVHMAAQRDAERLTGLRKGGISALALLDRHWPVVIDETALLFDEIWVSAGRVGAGVIVPLDGLVRVLGAELADIAETGVPVVTGQILTLAMAHLTGGDGAVTG